MQFPNIFILYDISCCCTLTSVPCESGLSIVKLIKSERKGKMDAKTLNDLMMIKLNGPEELSKEQMSEILDMWQNVH